MLPVIVFALFIILVDLYTYKGLKILREKPVSAAVRLTLISLFWMIPVILFSTVIYAIKLTPDQPDPRIFNRYYYIVAFTMLFYLPKLVFIVFHLIEDLFIITERSVKFLTGYIRQIYVPYGELKRQKRNLFSRIGFVIAIIPFLAVIYGVTVGRFDFQIISKTVEFDNLPSSFDGFRIVHISDLHTGSFYGYEDHVRKAVEKINRQKPDAIFFTGDLVNNFTSELDGFIDILSEMDARYGKFSILGNHDYGDYFQWESAAEKEQNMNEMISAQELIGFRLLMNQWDTISVNGEKIAVIGVENWGLPPFPRHGDLKTAADGTEIFPFRILLTHDPSHWDAEVLGKTGIDLTLSGHTHGMQFGIEAGNFRWSPSKFKYPRWAGLYNENGQYLYVNRGLGFIAFPGRIGMPPEITVIELRRSH